MLFCEIFSPGTHVYGCAKPGYPCPLRADEGCCGDLWMRWVSLQTPANAQAVLDYIRARRKEWEAEQKRKEPKMSRVKIELLDDDSHEALGVPWLEAPLGPARVVDVGCSNSVKLGDIVVIMAVDPYITRDRYQRLMLRGGYRPEATWAFEEVRVHPLNQPVKLTFE